MKKCHKWMREGMVMMMMRIHRLPGLGSSAVEFPKCLTKKGVGDGARIAPNLGSVGDGIWMTKIKTYWNCRVDIHE
jgi:hypothetical protein